MNLTIPITPYVIFWAIVGAILIALLVAVILIWAQILYALRDLVEVLTRWEEDR